MIRMNKTYLMLAAFLLAISATTFSQGTDPGNEDVRIEQVRLAIERTDELIEQAQSGLNNAGSLLARNALEFAVKLQNEAKRNFESENYYLSYRLTRQAREKAKYAISQGLFAEQSKDAVLRKLEHCDEMLQRAQGAIPETDIDFLEAMFQSARATLEKAWNLYRAEQFRPALKLANQVDNALRRILSRVDAKIRMGGNYELRSENVAELIERTSDHVAGCTHETGLRRMEAARLLYRRATDLASQEKYSAALKSLQQARKAALAAERECQGTVGLDQQYQRLIDMADRVRDGISPEDEASRLVLTQAYDQLKLARAAMDKDDFRAAAAALRATQMMLEQIRAGSSPAGL